MRQLALSLFAALMFMALPVAAETVDGFLIDKMCSAKIVEKGGGAAKMHTKMCAQMPDCKASGYGVVTADGKYLKFDDSGDKKATAALDGTDKKDNITVTVDGKVDGSSIAVESLKIT